MTAFEIPNPNKKLEDMSWMEKVNLVRILSGYPATALMVFIRVRVGYRAIQPTWFLILTVAMLIVALMFRDFVQPFGLVFVLYFLFMFVVAHFQRWRRWGEICRGERWHSYSHGYSYFYLLPLPKWLLSHYRVHRFLDPAAVLLIGLLMLWLSHGLGLWLVFSAFCLFIHEQNVYEKQLGHDLDILDSLIAGEVQAETVKHFEGNQSEQKQRTITDTAGIPTGLAPDIHKQVELRRAKLAKAPDNLAQATS